MVAGVTDWRSFVIFSAWGDGDILPPPWSPLSPPTYRYDTLTRLIYSTPSIYQFSTLTNYPNTPGILCFNDNVKWIPLLGCKGQFCCCQLVHIRGYDFRQIRRKIFCLKPQLYPIKKGNLYLAEWYIMFVFQDSFILSWQPKVMALLL